MEDKFNKSINEIFLELDELDQSAGEREEGIDTFENSNSLEQVKAEEYYEDIRSNSFEGFEKRHLPLTKKVKTQQQGKHQGSQV